MSLPALAQLNPRQTKWKTEKAEYALSIGGMVLTDKEGRVITITK